MQLSPKTEVVHLTLTTQATTENSSLLAQIILTPEDYHIG
jgi:hypothetical protein